MKPYRRLARLPDFVASLIVLLFAVTNSLRADALGTTSVVVGAAVGTNSVVLAAGGPWTATVEPTASWLHLGAAIQTGTGSTNVIFTYDSNPGATRVGTMTIDGMTLTVTQAGVGYVPVGTPIPIITSGVLSPSGVALDGEGNVYYTDTDYNAVYKWQPGASNAVLLASGFSTPSGVAVDGTGSVYVSDTGNGAVYAWHPGDSNTLPAVIFSHPFHAPADVAVGAAGALLIADLGYSSPAGGVSHQGIRVIEGLPGNTNYTTLVSDGVTVPFGLAVDAAGVVYITDPEAAPPAIRIWRPGQVSASTLSSASHPWHVAVDGSGNVYTTDQLADAIFVWRPGQPQTTSVLTVGSGGYGNENGGSGGVYGVAVDGAGNVYFADTGGPSIQMLPNAFVDPTPVSRSGASGSGTLPPVMPTSMSLTGALQPTTDQPWLTILGAVNGVVSYHVDANLASVSRTGHVSILGQSIEITQSPAAVTYGLGRGVALVGPGAGSDSVILAVSEPAAPWVASSTASWIHLDPASQSGVGSATLAFSYDANPGATRSGTIAIAGLTLTVTQAGGGYLRAAPFTVLTTNDLAFPYGVAVDSAGNVYIADENGKAIRKWAMDTQTVTTLATTEGAADCVAADAVGNVYFSDSGIKLSDGSSWVVAPRIRKVAAGTTNVTTLVTFTSLRSRPHGLAVDSSGSIYYDDAGEHAADYVIKQWQAASQTVVTLGSTSFSQLAGLAVDAADNVYVVSLNSGTVSKWTATASAWISLVGNESLTLNAPQGIAVDGAGALYIADSAHNAIKVWRPVDQVFRYLETTNQALNYPCGVAVDGDGNVFVADSLNRAVKEVPRAFVDTTARNMPNMAGNGALPPVLPATANLTGSFAPASDQTWLTIDGVTNGVVSFSLMENTSGINRTANVTVLGLSVAITQTGLPLSTTLAATNVGQFSATLNATVNPVGSATTTWFEYGTTTGYGNSTTTMSLPAGTVEIPTTSLLNWLMAGTTYHFRVVSANGSGTTMGADMTFTTAPAAVTLGANNIVVGPTGGPSGVLLAENGVWPMTTSTSWLHLSSDHTPGVGRTNVVFTCDPNPGFARTGTITIGGETLFVEQAAGGSVRAGAVLLFENGVGPGALAVQGAGDIVYASEDGDRIWDWNSSRGNSLLSFGYADLKFLTVDGSGNVYFYDFGVGSVGGWSGSEGKNYLWSCFSCAGPALDPFGNAYFLDTSANQVYRKDAAGSAFANAGSYSSGHPYALAADISGNLYFTDTTANSIQQLSASSYTVNELVTNAAAPYPDGSGSLWGLGVDYSGNVYYGGDTTLWEWNAASRASSARAVVREKILGVAVDRDGDVYCSAKAPSTAGPGINGRVYKLPRAWVSQPTSGLVSRAGGSGSIRVVPSSYNLAGPGAPVSDQGWLTITGTSDGTVTYTIAANDSGAAREAHMTLLGTSFTITQSSPPVVGTEPASGVGLGATLSGVVYPQGAATAYWFEYGVTTNNYSGTMTNTLAGTVPEITVTSSIGDLALNTTYYFRIVATNWDGVTYGPYLTFVTPAATTPIALSINATNVSTTSVTLQGSVNPAGAATSYWFDYGLTTYYGRMIGPSSEAGAGESAVSVQSVLSGLRPGTTYHFRIVATNSIGAAFGRDITFTTAKVALAAANLLVAPSAGSDSVVLDMGVGGQLAGRAGLQGAPGGSWTASTTAPWLHLSPENQAGTGSGNVVFTFDANPGPTRSDTLTIAGETLTVTQAGASFARVDALTPLVSSGLSSPAGIEVDEAGNVYVADKGNNAVKQWRPSSQGLTTLVSEGLLAPSGVAVDGEGNVYIADRDNGAVKRWHAASQTVTTLVSDGVSAPHDVAVDNAGNVYIADFAHAMIKQWNEGSPAPGTLVAADKGLAGPMSVAVDGAGNVYMADTNQSILVLNPANQTVSTLVSAIAVAPRSVAVDGSGNVYFPDHANGVIEMWSAASQSVTTVAAAGLTSPTGVAVDGSRNVYVSDDATGTIHELPHAFVDATPRAVSGAAGVASLPGVLPVTANLSGPFAPTSDQPWLTITGVADGVVTFSFVANDSGTDRVARVNLLGHSIAITQASLPAPVRPTIRLAGGLGGGIQPGTPGGTFGFEFNGTPGVSYRVLATTDLSLPLDQWRSLGLAEEIPAGSGSYRFQDMQATDVLRFYVLVDR